MDLVLDPVIVWWARLVLAGLFAGAAASKLAALDAFTGVVQNYRLLPDALVRPVAVALPLVEGLVALGLLIEPTRPLAALAAAGLIVLFIGAMAVNLARGRTDIDCGCFATTLHQRLSWALVGRNGALLLLALVALPVELPARALSWFDLATVGAAAAATLLLYVAASRLFGLAPRGPGAEEARRHA